MKMNTLRFGVTMLLAGALLRIAYSVQGGTVDKIFFRAGLNVAVLAVVPIVYAIWRLPGDRSVSGKRWAIAAFLLFAVLILGDFYRLSYFGGVPFLRNLATIVHSPWFSGALLACIAAVIIFRQLRFRGEAKRK